MAIMGRGRILVEGAPEALTARLAGRLWRKVVSLDEAREWRATMPVVSTRLVAGRMEVRLVAETPPRDDLQPATATLEDVYFATLLEHGLGGEL